MNKTIQYMAIAAVVMFAASAVPQAAIAGDAAAGQWKAQTCLGCHGVPSYTNVYPTYHVPLLGGQHADYIVSALQAYKNGQRDHDTMVAQSHRLDKQGIADVAAYFSSLKSAPSNPQAQVPAELQTLVTTCSACHGNDGNSPIPLYPKIAGQHEDYLYHSLLSYKAGKRTNPIMNGIILTLDESSMKILSRYFAGQPGLSNSSISIKSRNTSE